jgi:hypothetical protein
MKKIVFTIVYLLLMISSRAQQYHPLVDTGIIWSQQGGEADWNDQSITDLGGENFVLDGDTDIQGLHYLLLKFRGTYYVQYKDGFPPFASGFNLNDSLHLIGALREDSSKRIWIRMFVTGLTSLAANVDTILYDFNLQATDTFHLSLMNAIVSFTDSIQLLNGAWRKQIHFNSDANWATQTWIEGIGSDGGLLANYTIPFEFTTRLACYRKNNELLYENIFDRWYISVDCDSMNILLGIQNAGGSSPALEIFPNPAYDFITLNLSSSNWSPAEINFKDVSGRSLFSAELNSHQPVQIPIDKFFNNNILYCELWQEGRLKAVKKILIARGP